MSGVVNKAVHVKLEPASSFSAAGKRVAVVGGTGGLGRALARFLAAKGAQVTVVGHLSRVEVLRGVCSRLGTGRADRVHRPRVFIMGFPGAGNPGQPDDLNSEREYKQFDAHMNTVAGNEALVIDAAKRYPHLGVYGLNPGLIRTNIRANALGGSGSLRFRLVEGMIGLLMISPQKYAARIGPLLLAPELDLWTGIHFNVKGLPIHSSVEMTEEHVARLIAASDALLAHT